MIRAPAVSVVIPLYNSRAWIAASLGSVLEQTFTDFEVIVVDDGSTDDGAQVASSFGDPRVRIVRQSNRGLAGARNTGIRHGRGDYFALLDADDLWAKEKLALHVANLESDSMIGVSFSWSTMIDETERDLGMMQRPRSGALDAAHIFCRNPVGNGSAPVIRREALDAVVFPDRTHGESCWFDESFRQSEDIEFWTRLASTSNWRFACVPEALTFYRVNRGGLSANVEAQFATWLRFRAAVRGYAPELEAEYGGLAQAYQLRYLARRAMFGGDVASALRLMMQALSSDARIMLHEPVRTGATLAASALLGLVPPSVRDRVVRKAASLAATASVLRV